jgi:hypothetical protein
MKFSATYCGLFGLVIFLFQSQAIAAYKPSLTFLREVHNFHINADGTSTELAESSIRIETASAVRRFGERKITYNGSHETVEVLEAYTLQPDGNKVPLEIDQIRTQDAGNGSSGVYSDEKEKLLIYPKVQVGSVLFYKYKSHQHIPDFPGHFSWAEHYSPFYVWKDVEFNLTHDPKIDLKFSVKGATGGPQPLLLSDAPGTLRYQYRFKQEQFSTPETGVVSLKDFASHIAVSSFKTYGDVGLAYQDRAFPKATVTQQIKALALQLTEEDKTSADKIRSLYNWVSKNIRYVGVYVGAGGYVPHEAQAILDNRYGDCKDHVTLLEALLRSVDIESSPALINSDDTYTLPALPAPGVFDHVITYIPSLNLYLDSTSEFSPFGKLPGSDLQKQVVLTASGTIGSTPQIDINKDFTESRSYMRIQPDGSIVGTSKSLMHGYAEIESRNNQAKYKDKDQDEIVNQLLYRFLEAGSGKIDTPDPKDLNAAWYVNAEFKLDPMVNIPGPSALAIPIGLAPGSIKWISMSPPNLQRKFPESCVTKRHVEEVTLEVPKVTVVTSIPKNVAFNQGELTYSAKYTRKENKIVVVRELVINRKNRFCQPNDEVDWLALTDVMKRDLRSQVFVR